MNFSNYKVMNIYTNSELNFIVPKVQLLMSFMINVEVVLRHFHRCRPVVLLLEGLRSHKVLVIREYGGHEGLRGSGRRSVTPYVHG
jgi:hypothetical protein